jgi:hypothetical protein
MSNWLFLWAFVYAAEQVVPCSRPASSCCCSLGGVENFSHDVVQEGKEELVDRVRVVEREGLVGGVQSVWNHQHAVAHNIIIMIIMLAAHHDADTRKNMPSPSGWLLQQ